MTPLTPITPELRAEASAIAGASADTISRARSLFDHLTGGLYRYADSADSSGAEALRPAVRVAPPTSPGCSSPGAGR